LKADFPEAKIEVIDYCNEAVLKSYARSMNNIRRRLTHPFTKKKIQKRNDSIARAQELLPLSSFRIVTDDYGRLFNEIKNLYDIIIVGSDAVWNWTIRGFPNAYFINSDICANRMSYAASSYGQDYSSLSQFQSEFLREAFSCFSYIGVRDEPTRKLVLAVNPELKPEHNCDPSLLLNLGLIDVDMDAILWKLKKCGINPNKPMIGVMGGDWLSKKIYSLFRREYQIIALYDPSQWANTYLFDLSPFEWARIFSLFKMTFTHYFHGTLLSIMNNILTFAVEADSDYSKRYDTKILDALKRLELAKYHYFRSQIEKSGWDRLKDEAVSSQASSTINFECHIERETRTYNNFRETLAKLLNFY
jgi:hypothetical protein